MSRMNTTARDLLHVAAGEEVAIIVETSSSLVLLLSYSKSCYNLLLSLVPQALALPTVCVAIWDW